MSLSKTLNDFIKYGGTSLWAKIILLFTSAIVSAKILRPDNYGLWIALSLILQYGMHLHFGIGNALIREVSFYRGKNDLLESDKVKNVAFCSMLFFSVITGAIIFLFSIIFANKYEKDILAALKLIALILVVQQIFDFFRRYFIAINNFEAVGRLKISLSLLTGILTIIFVLKFKLIGLPLALLFSYSLVLIYIFRRYKINISPELNIKRSLSLIKFGFPIMAGVIVYNLFVTIERPLVLHYFGKLNLGYYSLACISQDFLVLIPVALGHIVFVNLSQQYGKSGNIKELKELLSGPTILLSYILCVVLVIIYIFLPVVVKVFLPQYIPGINFARMALFGIFFLHLYILSGEFLLVINKQVHYFLFLLLALTMKVIIIYISIVTRMGIYGIVTGAAIVYFLFSNFIIIYSFLHFEKEFSKLIRYLAQIYAPFLYALLIVFAFHYYMQNLISSSLGEVNHLLISVPLLALLLLPLGYVFKILYLKKEIKISGSL